MKLSLTNSVHCLHCGKRLSLFQRFRRSLYCDEAHRDAHSDQINKRMLARLSVIEKSTAEIRWEQCERRMNVEELRTGFAVQN